MENRQDEIEIDLVKLIKTLLKNAWIIIISAILFGALFFYNAAFKVTPMYQASALMYVNNSTMSFLGGKISISPSELDAAQSLVDTYAVIVKTRTTLNEVIARADLDYSYEQLQSMVSASSVNGTEIFRITVNSRNPKEAEVIANTIVKVLPEKISDIVEGSSVRVVDYAVVPKSAISPNITKNTVLGILLGIIASSGVIVLLEIFNDTIEDDQYIKQNFDIPILAMVPNLKNKNSDKYGYEKYGYVNKPDKSDRK